MHATRIGLALLLSALLMLLAGAAPSAPAVAAPWRAAGLSGVVVAQLTVDRSGTGILYATAQAPAQTLRSRLLKTVDGGGSWVGLARGLPAGFVPFALAVSPEGGRTVLAAGEAGLFRSTTAGATWSAVQGPLAPLTALAFDQAHLLVALAGTELNGNFRSADGGSSWRPANLGLPRDHYGTIPGAVQFVQHPTNSNVFYMATNGFAGVYRSVDGGLSWDAMGNGLPSRALRGLTINPAAPENLFALTENGLARWNEAAQTWTPITTMPPIQPVAMEFEPGAKETIYLAGADGALLRSTTNGASWVAMPSLPRGVRSLVSWPTATNPVLAAAAGEGIWQTPLRPTLPASPLAPAANRQYFSETGHNVSATFLPFFRQLGGLDRFGLPRTEEMADGGLTVQYFQRARLEYHPERKGTPYEVQISLIGEWLLGPERPPRAEPMGENGPDLRYFDETGHNVSYAFWRYYNTRGGLDSLGFPVTEELQENGRPVQYFQRARLEYHEEFKGTPAEVQLGPIGDEVLKQRDWLE